VADARDQLNPVGERSVVRQWRMAAVPVAGREALMGSKDKGGRSSKTAPARSLKEKRLDKKAKKAAHGSDANQSVERAFGR
jgi:hypothetical protein